MTAPAVTLASANSAEQTLTLTFNEALATTGLPPSGQFAVTTGGATNTVMAVGVVDNKVVLTLQNAFGAGDAISVTYTDPSVGNDANAIQDLAGNDAAGFAFSSGLVADGYVRGAAIWIDTDGDGIENVNTNVLTDESGLFFLPPGAPSGTIMALGGVNIDTGMPNTMVLKAPEGSTVINPLTTLVQAVLDSDPALTPEAAEQAVQEVLGISGTVDLLNYDPIAAGDVGAQKAAALVATVVSLAETSTGDGGAVVSVLAEQILVADSSNQVVSLTDSATLALVLNDAGVTSNDVINAVTAAATDIGAATSLDDISGAQSQALDTIAPAAPIALTVDALTNNSLPVVRVTLDVLSTGGAAVVAGDVISVRQTDLNQELGSATLTLANLQAGYVDMTLTVPLVVGVNPLSVHITDQANNAGPAALTSVTLDTTAPDAPIINPVAANDIVDAAEKAEGITVSGTSDTGNTVVVTWGGVDKEAQTVAGVWSVQFTSAEVPADGAVSVSAVATDGAGNEGVAAVRSVAVVGAVNLPGAVSAAVIDPVNGVFFNTEAGGGTASAFHIRPSDGVYVEITQAQFTAIENAQGVPAGVGFVAGGNGNDNLDREAETTTQWLAGGAGGDSLVGGSAGDVLVGDVLVGGAGDDRLRAGLGSDVQHGGDGTDRFQYYGANELQGDTVTGTRTLWNSDPASLAAGADSSSVDRVQLLGADTYNFADAQVQYVDRVDIGADPGSAPYTVVLSSAMAASADGNSNGSFGDIHVVGYDLNPDDPAPTTANLLLDATGLVAGQSVVVRGGTGSNVLAGGTPFGGLGGNDTLNGGAGNDFIDGGAGSDRLRGGLGVDTLLGNAGEDRIQYFNAAHIVGDIITGTQTFWDGVNPADIAAGADGSFVDRLHLFGYGSYNLAEASISYIDRIDIGSGYSEDPQGDFSIALSARMAATADANRDGVFGDLVVFGSAAPTGEAPTTSNILLDGSSLTADQSLRVFGQGQLVNNVAFGGMHGNDTLTGGAGADNIHAGAGNDRLRGGLGVDTLWGGDGEDRIQYFDAAHFIGDFITGTNDFWSGQNVGDIPTAADNTLLDRLHLFGYGSYNFADAAISYIDRIDIGSGYVDGPQGDFAVTLSSYTASTADANRDGVFGDLLVFGSHATTGEAPTTSDILLDGTQLLDSQSVRILGGGQVVNNVVFGGMHGNDTLWGGAGQDYIHGGAGNDRLRGGLGLDTLLGGAGEDRVQYVADAQLAGDIVSGTGVLWDGNLANLAAGADATTVDRLQLLGAGNYNFNGAQVQFIDRLDVGADPGSAPFTLVLSSSMAASADGNSNGVFGDIHVVGYDLSPTNASPTTANVLVDATALVVGQSVVVRGADGSNVQTGTPFGGMAGDDTLLGGAGNDFLQAGAGDDQIHGGGGADRLSGGEGADLFVFAQGDAPAISGVDLGGDGVLSAGDTFSFGNGLDQVADFASGDTLSLAPTLEFSLSGDQSFFIALGNYDPVGTFVVASGGADTLLVYDGDASANVVQTAILLSGVSDLAALQVNAHLITHA